MARIARDLASILLPCILIFASCAEKNAPSSARAKAEPMAEKTGPRAPPSAPPEKKIIAHWTFDEGIGDTATDAGKAGHQGKVKNAEWATGKLGSALHFGGKESCVIVPDAPDLSLVEGPFTVECWFRIEKAETAAKQYQQTCELLNKAGDRGPGWRLYITWNMIVFRSGEGGHDEKSKFWQVASNPHSTAIIVGQWMHVAVTRDETGTVRLYVQGMEQAKSETPFLVTPNPAKGLHIGNYGGNAYQFHGEIDEVIIEKRAKTPIEIFREARIDN